MHGDVTGVGFLSDYHIDLSVEFSGGVFTCRKATACDYMRIEHERN